ncbi:hypothetical protein [Pedobacter nyackensis]|uniref:Uncharacterized protein n=1 Tax=Pedobacter nyackensis TaxID=475255 RepID=A0A1W2A0C8_9SPHI|nr:hypothetical protein [Pedobacter nyackensis]SMC54189.1 hypothetical protein SAMN04488101_101225 [Pedobacter nyackensis]
MININVGIYGGKAPIPVKVHIDNLDNNNDLYFSRTSSFNETYTLPAGRYSILVAGMNPEDGYTNISVSGNFREEPLPEASFTRKTPSYAVFFYIEV